MYCRVYIFSCQLKIQPIFYHSVKEHIYYKNSSLWRTSTLYRTGAGQPTASGGGAAGDRRRRGRDRPQEAREG
jgi:hypothetical protein